MRLWKLTLCAVALSSGPAVVHAQPGYGPYGYVPYGPLPAAHAPHHQGYAHQPVVQFVEEPESPTRCGIMGGATLYILRPYFNNNAAFIQFNDLDGPFQTEHTSDFDWNFKACPAGWIGYTSHCGVGGRVRGFNFNHSAEGQTALVTLTDFANGVAVFTPPDISPETSFFPFTLSSPGFLLSSGIGQDALTFESDLRITTVDGEATYAFDLGHLSMLFAVGGRYLSMKQTYQARLANIVSADTFELMALDSIREFEGGGPTVAWQGRWEFGRSGMSVFGTVRGSIVVGTTKSSAALAQFVSDPTTLPGGPGQLTGFKDADDSVVMPIGEVEAGFEYGRLLGRTRVFLRGAAVNHTYFESGSSSSNDGAVSLFGGQVSFGINY